MLRPRMVERLDTLEQNRPNGGGGCVMLTGAISFVAGVVIGALGRWACACDNKAESAYAIWEDGYNQGRRDAARKKQVKP